jgi:Protein of unknown function (DUF3306)
LSRDGEGFLSRWSRRKRALGRAAPPSPPVAPAPAEAAPPPDAAGPAFDPASLPPIESLTTESDFAAFLREEVPAALRRAALRRAWTLDPAIRDFVGPADYAWDFNAPDGVPGFSLDLGGDVERLIAQAVGLGEAPAEAKAGEAPPLPAAVAETVAPPSSPPSLPDHALEAPPPSTPASPDSLPAPVAPVAGLPPPAVGRRRRHGGALPS